MSAKDAGKQSPQELLNEARMGNLQAAYELLGKQAPTRMWTEALEQIARRAEEADIELVAHRALRRPRQVVAGLLDLAEKIGTPKAGHVSHAVACLLEETDLVDRARAVREGVSAAHELDTTLARGHGADALYLVLSQPLPIQLETMGALLSDQESLGLIVDALGSEYQRLRELGKEVRWKSGGYRYFLRHALADLALVGDIGGRTWELAYRLLQQQVESPEDNTELIEVMPASTRRRYIAWGLERENAAAHPLRTSFILEVSRAHPEDVQRSDVVAVLKVEDPEIRADAMLTAVALAPSAGDIDWEIAEWLAVADSTAAQSLVRSLLELSPARLRPDLLGEDNRRLVADLGSEQAPALARSAAALVGEARSAETVVAAVDMLDLLDERFGVATDVYAEVARDLMRRIDNDSRWQATFEDALTSPGMVRGAWDALPDMPNPGLVGHFRAILRRSAPDEAGRGTARLLQAVHALAPSLYGDVLDAVVADALEPEELRSVPVSVLSELAAQAHVRAQAVRCDIDAARKDLGSGQKAVEHQMREKLRPIVERAIERAEGNNRLALDYQRLLPSDSMVAVVPPTAVLAVPKSAWVELEKVGAEAHVDGTVEVEFLEASNEAPRLRYLTVLDKRARAQSALDWQALLAAYVSALGRHGDAAMLVTELFERGPRMKLVLGLSSEARRQLLEAAIGNGLVVPEAWHAHDTLGSWLTSALGSSSDARGEEPDSDPIKMLLALRTQARELAEVRERADLLEHNAKLAFVDECRSAFSDLELAIDGYVQLWRALAGLGIAQVEPLGVSVERSSLDSGRHEIVGEPEGERFIVRAAGIEVDGEVVVPARLEQAEV